MQDFVEKGNITRQIWGNSDTILFIFAGAAAEFALNKAVDWLYFTGKLPADPLGRLFSTVTYARKIIFAGEPDALAAIDNITAIHKAVESSRGDTIPAWAYRDVLFMLIYYSIRSYELLEHNLSPNQKEEVYQVFFRVGNRMGLTGLPGTYVEWLPVRKLHLDNDLAYSAYTKDLFAQYKKHLGKVRNQLMLRVQALLVPLPLKKMLSLPDGRAIGTMVKMYKKTRKTATVSWLKNSLLPVKYREQIKELDQPG